MNPPISIIESDDNDPIGGARSKFEIPDGVVYLDGNSLGPVCLPAKRALQKAQQQWQQDLIGSWNQHSWIDLPSIVGEKIAPLIGAQTGQVICCDSISVNLFKLVAGALKMQGGRTTIVSETGNFPTDLYMLEGLQSLLGHDRLRIKLVDTNDLESAIDETVAIVMLTQVNFKTGAKHDMAKINSIARQHGALSLWDLAHSAGAFAVELDSSGADFAVGCGYKYLNGGPGAPAFVYVAKRHHGQVQQPLSGWMGHKNPFAFTNNYQANEGVASFLSGTPSILAMATLNGALDLFDGIDLQQVEQKSLGLQKAFLDGLGEPLSQLQLITSLTQAHGSQLSFAHEEAYAIAQNLISDNVVVDFRAPNILRVGFAPLYLRFSDCWQAGKILGQILNSKSYLKPRFKHRQKVT